MSAPIALLAAQETASLRIEVLPRTSAAAAGILNQKPDVPGLL